jgi:hypothetical protein
MFVMEDTMKLKFLVPSALALTVLAAPAFAQGYYNYYDEAPINGSQLTDMPSQRSNVTITGSFLAPEPSYEQRYDEWAQEQAYRDYYYRNYGPRYYDYDDGDW